MKSLVIFSGGQDSTTCLGLALQEYEEVEAINFNYGQKHSIEIGCARKICEKLEVKLHEVDVSFLGNLVDSALTSNGDVNENHIRLQNLPASFVPNRNALFITLAHALAQKIGAKVLYTGVCETDYSGYPDCRNEFIEDIEKTLNKGSQADIDIITPLMFKNKAEIFKIAEKAGVLYEVVEMSHTCYNGDHETYNIWGYGCGDCPACKLRSKGWEEYLEMT